MLDTALAVRLRKIQIMAEKGTVEEQKVAAAKLQKLLTQNGLELTDITPLDNEGRPKPTYTRRVLHGIPNQGWRRDLIHGLAKANKGTSVGEGYGFRSGTKVKKVALIVQEKLAGEIEQLYHYWVQEIEYLAKEYQKARNRGEVRDGWYHGRTVMKSYREGLTDGIVSTISEAARLQEKEMREMYTGTSALVLSLDKERDDFVNGYYGKLSYGSRSSSGRSYGAYSSGYTEGRNQSSSMHRKLV